MRRFSLVKLALGLSLIAGTLACNKIDSKLEDPVGVSSDQIIQLSRDQAPLRADGVSKTTLTAKIPTEASSRDVKFTTSSGSFLGAGTNPKELTVKANPDGSAEAELRMGTTVEPLVLSAEVGGFRTIREEQPLRAHAEQIIGESTAVAIGTAADSPGVPLTAFLQRSQGFVSVGTEVQFTAFQRGADGQEKSVGRFSNLDKARTDANGKATITFHADTGDVTAGTPIRIVMSTLTDSGQQIRFELTLQTT